MTKFKTQIATLLFVSVLGFSVLMQGGVNYAVDWLLKEEAQDTGMDWAHLIDARMSKLESEAASQKQGQSFETHEITELTEMSEGIFAVGNIYQIDFLNSLCHCTATLKRSEGQVGSPAQIDSHEHHDHGSHDDVRAEIQLRPSQQIHASATEQSSIKNSLTSDTVFAHVLSNSTAHDPMSGRLDERIPILIEVAREIVATKKHATFIREIEFDGRQKVVGEVFHPVIRSGETRYVLRVLVDLTSQANWYSKFIYIGIFSVLAFLLVCFSYPALKYLRSSRLHRAADERAHFLAKHDVLTGVSNRNAFQELAPERLEACRCTDHEGVLMIVDIDNFKEINDFYGHHVGDAVLHKIAGLLKGMVSQNCIVARLGGDEFGIMSCETNLLNYKPSGDLDLPKSFEMELDGSLEKLSVTFSIGFARYPSHGTDLPELMRNADLALYAAKKDERSGAREYDPQMSEAFQERLELFNEFKKALLNSQIEPYYQPLVNAQTGEVEGLEALLRWNHPEKGVLTASSFSDVLDDHEICGLIGHQMLHRITEDMGRWKRQGVNFCSVGLNVDSADLLRPGFILDVVSNLAKHNLKPHNLAIEVTENIVFGPHYQALLQKLRELRELGCYVALDDFGTGYSSITHLKELPYTAIKIDKSFVRNIVSDRMDQAIVEALVQLGDSIEFKLVAEGVETAEQLDTVFALGCHLVQGYYFSEALSAQDVPAVLQRLNKMSSATSPGSLAQSA